MLRYDEHRPSVIVPEDYDYVACECIKIEDIGNAEFIRAERERIRRHMEKTGGTYSNHAHGGNCHICGSVNAIYTTLFWHKPTNTYIRCGTDCAEKLGSYEFALFRKNVLNALANKAGKAKALVILSDKGLEQAFAISESKEYGYEENIIRDIVGKLVLYGNLSDKQFSFIKSLIEKISRREERNAKRKTEHEAAEILPPNGDRLEIIGTVIARKSQEFGPDKLLIQSDTGWKVWGTVPSAIHEVAKGNRVSFMARIEPSKDDAKFGFYSRPSKAKIIS